MLQQHLDWELIGLVDFMDYRLQVFKYENISRSSGTTYRFAVVDYSRSSSYPSNFICMLPAKVEVAKGKSTSAFGGLFGDKCVPLAIELLSKALKSEKEADVKIEIERRLKLLDSKQTGCFECTECKIIFHQAKGRKYKQRVCRDCYRKKFSRQY